MMKKEREIKIDTLMRYCPLCDEVHEQDVISREVTATLSDRDVTYKELLYRCRCTEYETVITRDLKEGVEDQEIEKPKRDNTKRPQWETCFGFDGVSKCRILTEMVCIKKNCKFHKTQEEFNRAAKLWKY